MRNTIRLMCVVFVVGLLGGCFDKDSPTSSNTPVTLTVKNGLSLWSIYGVQISPVGDDSWGTDWLGSSDTIRPGQSRSFDLVSGKYDLAAIDEDGDCYYSSNQNINSSKIWTVTIDALDTACSKHSSGKLSASANKLPVVD